MNDAIEATLEARAESIQAANRPFITLSYAQSLDGSIAAAPGAPYPLSGSESLEMTHKLRSAHDSILIGIGTALADDPQLNVRFSAGKDPDPIVLDSQLRLPTDSQLFSIPHRKVHIFCSEPIGAKRAAALSSAGASIHPTPKNSRGMLDIPTVLVALRDMGYRSLMVEGGATVIAEFIHAKVIDWFVMTIAPLMLGGLKVTLPRPGVDQWTPVQFEPRGTAMYGRDRVIWGRPAWEAR